MDPNWYQSIVGISAAAIAVGAALRQWAADISPLNKLPLVVYVAITSLLFTAFAHYGLGTLEGDILRLLTDALTAAVGAVGVVGITTNLVKPLSQTSGTSVRKFSMLFALALAGSMTMGCAGKAAQIAVAADDAMHDGLARGHDELDARCVVTNPNALTPPTCTALKATLADVFAAYRHVNHKIREGFRLSQLAAEIGTFKARIDAVVASIRKLVAEGGELIAGELLRSRSVFDEEGGGTLHPLEE